MMAKIKMVEELLVRSAKLKTAARRYLPSWITTLRWLSLCVFLYSTFSITVSWTSLLSFVVLLVSIYGVDSQDSQTLDKKNKPDFSANPLKGKPRLTSLSESREREVNAAVGHFVADYDPQSCTPLERFEPVKQGSECVFARRAKIWGSRDWDSGLSLEENVFRSVPMFLKFTLVCQELGLDGFLFLLPGQQYGGSPQDLGKGVRRLLQTLSDLDPRGAGCMDKAYIDKPGWVFQFNRQTFFVTTFAPCYPASHSRYAHGARDSFALLQPEMSFAQHDLPPDTVETEWERPLTVRDRIRKAFREAGRGYLIRETLVFPMVHDIVKPLREDGGDSVVEWWVK